MGALFPSGNGRAGTWVTFDPPLRAAALDVAKTENKLNPPAVMFADEMWTSGPPMASSFLLFTYSSILFILFTHSLDQ